MTNDSPARPRATLLLLAAGCALANGLWSIFLWKQLHVARSGGDPYCALGGGCQALWDGAFANQVQAVTGVPIAGWGLIWSVAALALALWVWTASRSGSAPSNAQGGLAWLAAAGGLAVVALLAVSLASGGFCGSCAVTYGFVAAFAGLVIVALPDLGTQLWAQGVLPAAVSVLLAFGMALVPGMQTPRAGSSLGTELLPQSPQQEASESTQSSTAPQAAAPPDSLAGLKQLLDSLPPAERQNFANARAAYMDAEPVALRQPRALSGARMAPIRLVTWTDSGCSHCAFFHDGLTRMLQVVPKASIAIEQRVFPLDRSCNIHVAGIGREEVCLAARVRVCLEENPRAHALSGWLHEEAQPLSTESIYQVATRLADRATLEACVESDETQAKIDEDIEYGVAMGLQGTPYVLMNGRRTEPYVPLIYALAITQGDARHAVFDSLPPAIAATPGAAGHEGHAH